MTTEINTKWDYEKLNIALVHLRFKAMEEMEFALNATDDETRDAYVDESKMYLHVIEFIEYSMEQLEVLSPTQHYLTHE